MVICSARVIYSRALLRHPDYTRARLAQLAERMKRAIYPETRAVEVLEVSGPVGRIGFDEAEVLEYRPAKLGEQLGPLWSTFWFRASARVPESWRDRRVDLLWISHSEATLWIRGTSRQGLNHHPRAHVDGSTRPDAVLIPRARGGEAIDFHVEVACNGMFGAPEREHRPFHHVSPFVLDRCDLALFDREAWDLYFDFSVLQELEVESGRDLDKTWGGLLLAELDRFANIYDPEDRSTWPMGQGILRELYARKNATTVHELTAIGHAHIDTAWLWPIAETYRKCVRTFSSQVAYMDEYPEHRFACSQAQQWAWIKERSPELWARIVEKVRAGQFIPAGGTWVEPDCNLPSGESLARQFLYGQRFFERELGRRCRELWQPDVFGYNGQLPQLMRLAGIDRFLTQKLSWNRFNRPAHHTFTWQGIDGSEVLAHFPPADTYNSNADVAELRRVARDYKDHDRSRSSLMLFGHGDGGGGPTKRMLEVLRRARELQGLPRTALRTPEEFFDRLAAEVTDLPVLVGELYFEYHRGTYTTQAETKKNNRRAEFLLRDVELLSACADRLGLLEYPRAELERLWKLVLVNQFHDILPGSSIAEVYEDAAKDYAEVFRAGGALRERAAVALAGGAAPINTLPFARAEVCEGPDGSLAFVEAPSCGVGRVADARDRVTVSKLVLENSQLRAELGEDGTIRSLIDKSSGREALAAPGNVLEIYDDQPTAYDAWDVDPFHLETRRECPPAESAAVIEDRILRGAVRFERRIGRESRMTQIVRLSAGSRRLEVHCEVDWRESEKMLKVAFPVAVRAMNATYEMQFGCVERPTHYNTSYDLARYEVPGHKWCDLSEHGFGVALLGDSKYGWSTYQNTMRMSLLRAPKMPDPRADRGVHRFAYAIVPHAAGWQDAGIVEEAYRFNVPVLWAGGGGSGGTGSFFDVDDRRLVLDTVKKAEDSDALVLRLYESCGGRGLARVSVSLPFSRAWFANLLEDRGSAAKVEGGVIEVPYRPFQIITLVLE